MATNNGNLIITGGSGKKILNNHYIVAEEHQNKWILLKPTFIRMLGRSSRIFVEGVCDFKNRPQ